MTDLETFEKILNNREIGYEKHQFNDLVILEIWGGYIGFYTKISFDSEGNLTNIEAFE